VNRSPLARFGLLLVALLAAAPALARSITDSSGRTVEIPDKITRVFAAGPPASVLQYMLAPQTMLGWVRQPRPADKPYLLPETRELPTLGRLTGGGDTVNLEVIVAARPDLILDFGTISDTYKSLADRVQAQSGVPYILIDGRFANTAAALRLLGDILGAKERGETLAKYAEDSLAEVDRVLAAVPADARPRVYLARGPEGLETGTRGSINTEIIERVGAVNVVEGFAGRAGLVNASPEQVLAWAPDTIITLDAGFAAPVADKPQWQGVSAVAKKRVFVAPDKPFGFIDSPPGVNRLVGLRWLLAQLYPDKVTTDVRTAVRDFYTLFYQVSLSDADVDKLLGAATK
jgi:iron complex transport system substrate-binding protein